MNIRGHRVGIEAVEAALLRHPRIAAAAAQMWPGAAHENQLSIYVVAKDGSAPNLSELRTFLASSYPEPIIPSEVIVLAALPLNSDGTIDRSKLRAPSSTSASKPATPHAALPPGVTAVQAGGNRRNIFWVHILVSTWRGKSIRISRCIS